MTRRDCLIALAALPGLHAKAEARGSFTPLDELTFRPTVTAHSGRALLVDLWAARCAPCLKEMPRLISLCAAQKGRGLDLITICCDEPEQLPAAARFLDKQGAPLPRYLLHPKKDDDFKREFDPKWSGLLPALFLFDRNGSQTQSFIGATNMSSLQAAIERALTSQLRVS